MEAARFGRYRLERLLGRGGMGQVWRAHDTESGRAVALKLLPAELAVDADYRKRFAREAEVAAALRDPHIVAIHRHGAIDGRLFIEMDYIEGTDLAARLAAHGTLDPRAALAILGQVAGALDAAHRAGLVHRDVKPSNILVRPDGFTYLIDFGIARVTGQTSVTTTGLAIGTWAYMAPERFSGDADARSDVYSLACVLYECLTGRRPYGDTDPARQMHGHLMTEPPRASAHNPDVPAALDDVIARGMSKEPAERPARAGEFVRAAVYAVVGGRADSPGGSSERAGSGTPRPAEPGGANPAPLSGLPAAHFESASGAAMAGFAVPNPSGALGPQGTKVHSQPRLPLTRVGGPDAVGPPTPGSDNRPSVASAGPQGTKVLAQPDRPATRVETRYTAPPAVSRGTGVLPVDPRGNPPVGWVDSRPYRPAPGYGWPAPVPAGKRWYLRRKARAGRWPSRGPAYLVPRRPQPPPRRKRGGVLKKALTALLVIFLAPFVFAIGCLALIAAGSGESEPGTAPPAAIVEDTPPGAPAQAGGPARDGKFEFAVTGVDSGVSRVGWQTARGTFLVVTLSVRNISDEGRWFVPFGQKLRDSTGAALEHDTTATAWESVQRGFGYPIQVDPGNTVDAVLVFDVPAGTTPTHLELHDFVFSGGVTIPLV
ncbi:protein kinase [Nocardia puris]|uniref:serine/threonine-protein kinase n=1 Tax=Nocardia puris TaxID=208602 RepID=UPI0018944042|nr:serine/threonine-protein kinase [Nocardia puris]MBF6212343.1 protein kinase [Nocardia puris]MBF6366590.1 protein kinase [Nocardia puris]MBF6460932.1 protein kinase [Nocardia puris]